MKLYLDDERSAPDDSWTLVRTYKECLDALKKNWHDIKEISLDHDLGDEYFNGYRILLYMEWRVEEEGETYVPEIHIHTANASAMLKMEHAVENIEKLQLLNVCRGLIIENFRADRGMYATEFIHATLTTREAAIIAAMRSAGRKHPYTLEDLNNV